MSRSPVHRPPADPDVAALVAAGISLSTAVAMEPWKAREVLELLRVGRRPESDQQSALRTRGTL